MKFTTILMKDNDCTVKFQRTYVFKFTISVRKTASNTVN